MVMHTLDMATEWLGTPPGCGTRCHISQLFSDQEPLHRPTCSSPASQRHMLLIKQTHIEAAHQRPSCVTMDARNVAQTQQTTAMMLHTCCLCGLVNSAADAVDAAPKRYSLNSGKNARHKACSCTPDNRRNQSKT